MKCAMFRTAAILSARRRRYPMRRNASPIRLGIESWARSLASRSHWFFSQTSRWRTRRIMGTIIITPITPTTTTLIIDLGH